MSEDHKLPVKTPNQPSPVAREIYTQSPVQGRSLVGRLFSRFTALLNTKAIAANTEQVNAFNDYVVARGRTADVMLDTDRKIANYVDHRDDIIANDHERHLDAMDDERAQRELNRLRRAEMLRDAHANVDNSAVHRDVDARILKHVKEKELTEAEWQMARAKWGLEAFTQSMPYRKERLLFFATKGALDEEIDMLIRGQARDQQLRSSNSASDEQPLQPPSPETIKSALDETIAELAHEIELARARQASDAELNALHAFLARLASKRAQE